MIIITKIVTFKLFLACCTKFSCNLNIFEFVKYLMSWYLLFNYTHCSRMLFHTHFKFWFYTENNCFKFVSIIKLLSSILLFLCIERSCRIHKKRKSFLVETPHVILPWPLFHNRARVCQKIMGKFPVSLFHIFILYFYD